MRPNFQRFSTFNFQELDDEVKRTNIADDFDKFRLKFRLQEIRIKETGLCEIHFIQWKNGLFI